MDDKSDTMSVTSHTSAAKRVLQTNQPLNEDPSEGSSEEEEGFQATVGQVRLMSALCQIQSRVMGTDDPHETFTFLLLELLKLMDCDFGFIGEVLTGDPGTGVHQKYLRTFAISNISWSPETSDLYSKLHKSGFIFSNLNTLFGHTLTESEPVITNDPQNDPRSRSGGVPKGHPPLKSYLGLPFFGRDGLIGMVGLANKNGGFHDDDIRFLQPLVLTCGSVIQWMWDRRARDEADKKYLEEQQKRLDEANAISRAKSLFLSNMSHELRTPMNGIMGMLELLSHTTMTSTQKDYVSTCVSSAEALLLVLDDIIFFSHTDTNQIKLENEPMSVNSIVEDAVLFLKESVQLKDSKINLYHNVDTDFPNMVMGDPRRLRQVVINLLGNAVKFTEKGHVSISVSMVNMIDDDLTLKFQVSDTGCGLDPDKIEALVEPFSQVDDSLTRGHGGLGLGLAICKRLITLFEGELDIKSRVNLGTDVEFTAKFKVCPQEKQTPIVALSPAASTQLKGKRILIVNDVSINTRSLSNILKSVHCRVETASLGSACLDMCEQASISNDPFNVVLVDDVLSDIAGFEVAKGLKASPHNLVSKVPVIILSNSYMDASNDEYTKLGNVFDVLVKPLLATNVVVAVNKVLETTDFLFSRRKPHCLLLVHQLGEDVRHFSTCGYDLVEVTDPAEAMKVVAERLGDFEGAVIDMAFDTPQKSSFLGYLEASGDLPIIALSRKTTTALDMEVIDSKRSVVSVLTPPYDSRQFQTAVHSITSGKFKILSGAGGDTSMSSSRPSSPPLWPVTNIKTSSSTSSQSEVKTTVDSYPAKKRVLIINESTDKQKLLSMMLNKVHVCKADSSLVNVGNTLDETDAVFIDEGVYAHSKEKAIVESWSERLNTNSCKVHFFLVAGQAAPRTSKLEGSGISGVLQKPVSHKTILGILEGM